MTPHEHVCPTCGAFPVNVVSTADVGFNQLRDWFAGLAMQSMTIGCGGYPHFNEIASRAYSVADAMLKERDRDK